MRLRAPWVISLLMLLSLGSARPVTAQIVATNANRFGLDQPAADLATAQAYTYRIYADGSPTAVVVPATCSGTTSPFLCAVPVSAAKLTPGAHTVTFTAANVAGESVPSAGLTFQLVAAPVAPANLRILP